MKKIDTVQIVRDIRDKQNIDIKDKSPQEIIDYFRKKATKIDKISEITQLSKR